MITRTITVVEYAVHYYDVDAKEEFVINCEIDKAHFKEKDCIKIFEENNPTCRVLYIELISEETNKYAMSIDKFISYANVVQNFMLQKRRDREEKEFGCDDNNSTD